ncbi:MAG: hypothetical protein BWZ09_02096 [Alphaproteobacteria bacterium ADurb.BinA305]|nr:MAG: hypothetical protein BWZ09_02096 [Alphaproteobacteria bacterium ADurb.BinA305]
MNRLTIIAAALSITVAGPGCGPIAGPDTRCEDEGGSWICDGNIGPAGGEKCWCDTDPHAEPRFEPQPQPW